MGDFRGGIGSCVRVMARVVTIGLAMGACVGASDESASDVAFTSVEAGETWSEVAMRLSGCERADSLGAVVDHLQRSNPLVDDVGLVGDQIVAYEPSRIKPRCDDADRDVAASAPSGSAVTEVDDEPVATVPTTNDGSEVPGTGPDSEGAPREANSVEAEPATSALSTGFFEDFAGPDPMSRFRWQVHHKPAFQGTPDTWMGDHDTECSAPPSVRTVNLPSEGNDPGEAAYVCAPGGAETAHMMTTFRSSGYAQVAFSPDEVFSSVSRVCWDQNQTDLGARKWTQVIVVPESTFQAEGERLDYVKPSIESGPGAAGVFLTDDVFLFVMQSGSTVTHVGQGATEEDFRGFTTDDKKRRYTTCIEDLENGAVRIELERDDSVEVREMQGSLSDGPARVIFQDDTYNSTKAPAAVEDPFTWHWDNILIET